MRSQVKFLRADEYAMGLLGLAELRRGLGMDHGWGMLSSESLAGYFKVRYPSRS